jgi:hypothetical protein
VLSQPLLSVVVARSYEDHTVAAGFKETSSKLSDEYVAYKSCIGGSYGVAGKLYSLCK